MAAQGAAAFFIPTNNGLPNNRAYPEVVQEARASDRARAVENRVWVIRADVAGENRDLISHGSSEIVDSHGTVIQEANGQKTDLLIADVAA
jgi:predicted amidohydrolase